MGRINRADWTKERIAAFRRYLAGDREASYRGRKKNGEMYKKSLKVKQLIDYYQGYNFSIGKKGKLMVDGEGFGPREVLTDDQEERQVIIKQKKLVWVKLPVYITL